MFSTLIKKALTEASGIKDPNLEFSSRYEFGDYTTNIALHGKNPREDAKRFLEKLGKNKNLKEIVEKIEIAGPGFINFHLSTKVITQNLSQIIEEKEKYAHSTEGKGKTVVIDYSSPNIAKRFSIGHLRSTIIGQALYNLYKALGYKVVGDNHLGDWGTQFGVLIYMVEKNKLDPKKLSVDEWEKLYVDFHTELEKNPDLKNESRNAFERLEKGDKDARKIWEVALETSMKEYQKLYDLLDVHIDYAYGESFYQDKMPEAIEEAKKKGMAKKSGDAWVVEFDKYNLPSNILVKSNGTTTYLARDLALMFFRKKQWNPTLQIFEVGADQKLYFRQVFALAEMMGLFKQDELKHIAHGMYRFKEGKMSTRRGKTIKLEEILSEAIKKAEKFNKETAKEVGIGAIKYFDLMHSPTTYIIFDWDKIFVLEGNSGPYLQYTYARTQSVLKKSKETKYNATETELNAEELMVGRELSKFPEIISMAAHAFSPNLLCEYLYNLASTFNTFYNKHKIIGGENEKFDLALTAATGQILKNGLTLLGIATPEKM